MRWPYSPTCSALETSWEQTLVAGPTVVDRLAGSRGIPIRICSLVSNLKSSLSSSNCLRRFKRYVYNKIHERADIIRSVGNVMMSTCWLRTCVSEESSRIPRVTAVAERNARSSPSPPVYQFKLCQYRITHTLPYGIEGTRHWSYPAAIKRKEGSYLFRNRWSSMTLIHSRLPSSF